MTTVCTFIVVNRCVEVCYGDSASFTFFLTLHTTDTANFTCFSCLSAFVLIDTTNMLCEFQRLDNNDMLRTSFCTKPTTYTKIRVYSSKTVADCNCIFRADSGTIAVAETAILTALSPAPHKTYSLTCIDTFIINLLINSIACTCTLDNSNLFLHRTCGNT